MKGIDVSHHNGVIDFAKVKGYEFVFAKCSEGTAFKDSYYQANKDKARAAGLLFGAYHFCDGYDPIKEADWFLKNVGDLKAGEIVILDYEISLSDPASWCLKWLKRVEEKLGFKPLLYTNEARVKSIDWKRVVDANYGLWVAKYASQVIYVPEYLQRNPVSDEWPFWAIWQFSSRASVPGIVGNVDVNTTNMSLEVLRKYGKQAPVEVCKHCKIPNHCQKI